MTPSQSRSHLYRPTPPSPPLASALLFALWLGAALLCAFALLPAPAGSVATAGGSAATLGRLLPLIAAGAIACGVLVIGTELVVRARHRGARMLCAAALLLAGSIVSFGSGPRDHMLYAAEERAEAPPTLADARAAHAPDIAWLTVALLAAAGGLATAVIAARSGDTAR